MLFRFLKFRPISFNLLKEDEFQQVLKLLKRLILKKTKILKSVKKTILIISYHSSNF